MVELNYSLPANGPVIIRIYVMLGNEVRTLVNNEQSAGNFKSIWDTRNDNGETVPAGMYFVKVSSGGRTETAKLVLSN
jgi:flagellar hook assembly protein FlgD